MKLDRLIAEREHVSTKPFPIAQSELLARFEKLYTGAVCDVLREYCLLDQAFPGHIKPLNDQHCVAGIAFTVKSAPNVQIRGEMSYRSEMLDKMKQDHFVVWDTTNDEKATLWGGVMTATAVSRGVKAACIDGGIRDTHQINEKNFPVYYRYRIPNGSLGRCLITHYEIPVKIGDVVVRPGDVILADIDGVLCIPRDIAYDVLLRSEEIRTNEKAIFSWVAKGETVQEIVRKGGYF